MHSSKHLAQTTQFPRHLAEETRGVSAPLLGQASIVVATLVCSAFFLFAEHQVAGKWGFSLDDSWIYATFARNLATGHGYSFNPGEPISGATAPLYVFILAPLYLIFRDVVMPAKIL